MKAHFSHPVQARVWGPRALFTRPEIRPDRVSYPVITPAAARGVFDALWWHPGGFWKIDTIAVCADIAWVHEKRNELNTGAGPLLITEHRTQRHSQMLRDVDYIITARYVTDGVENPTKGAKVFERRLRQGAQFHSPYLGSRECVANVSPVPDGHQPIAASEDFGTMFFDFDYSTSPETATFFQAVMHNGVVTVPRLEAVGLSLASFVSKEIS